MLLINKDKVKISVYSVLYILQRKKNKTLKRKGLVLTKIPTVNLFLTGP